MRKLGDIATVKTGFPFRNAVKPSESGRFRLVQIKDITEDSRLLCENLMRFDAEDIGEDYYLQHGDVLLVSRGLRNRAVVYKADCSNTVAGLQFIVIRPKKRQLDSYYLASFLNSADAQNYLLQNAMGSTTQFIPKQAFIDLNVPLPTFDEQRRIGELYELSLRENELVDKIKRLRGQLMQHAFHLQFRESNQFKRPHDRDENQSRRNK